jgi:hypothetical protein
MEVESRTYKVLHRHDPSHSPTGLPLIRNSCVTHTATRAHLATKCGLPACQALKAEILPRPLLSYQPFKFRAQISTLFLPRRSPSMDLPHGGRKGRIERLCEAQWCDNTSRRVAYESCGIDTQEFLRGWKAAECIPHCRATSMWGQVALSSLSVELAARTAPFANESCRSLPAGKR